MKSIEHSILRYSQITDTEQFFADITRAYLDYEQSALQLTSAATPATAEHILHECTKLKDQRSQLAVMDEQMLAIMDLAGNEIINTSMINNFKTALNRAVIACDALHNTLLAIRYTLRDDNH